MSPHKDRRLARRVATTIPIKPVEGSGWMIAHDLSVGGMQVTTTAPRWPGTLIPIRFRLPKSKQFLCMTARVIGLVDVPHGVGLSLQFLRLAPESDEAIRRYVSTQQLAA